MKAFVCQKSKLIILYLTMLLLTALFILSPVYDMFIDGVFSWHVSLNIFWRDLLELFLYGMFMAGLGVLFRPQRRILWIVLAGSIYLLSIGNVIGPVVVGYLYIQILLIIGMSLEALFVESLPAHYHGTRKDTALVLGIALWSFCAVIISLLGHGTIEELRWFTVMLFVFSMLNPKYHWTKNQMLGYELMAETRACDKKRYIVIVFYVMLFLLCFSRISSFIDSDSKWYALSPQYSLVGEHSFYDFLGYTCFVHYYPKLKELLFLPVSNLFGGTNPGYIVAPNVWFFFILISSVIGFLRLHLKKHDTLIFLLVLLPLNTVAINGIATTAKSDILSLFLMTTGFICLIEYFRAREGFLAVIGLIAFLLSYGTKPTCFLFSTITLLSFLICAIVKKIKARELYFLKKLWPLLLIGLGSIAGVTFRTVKLTGYPTYREGTGAWELLGFQAKQYFKPVSESMVGIKFNLLAWVERFTDLLILPERLGKMQSQWLGNFLFLFIFLIALSLLLRMICINDIFRQNKTLLLVPIPTMLISVPLVLGMDNPDGNYFIYPLMISFLMLCVLITGCFESKYLQPLIVSCSVAMILLNFFFTFTTHPSYGCATRFSFSTKYEMIQSNLPNIREERLKILGLENINSIISENWDGISLIADTGSMDVNFLNAKVQVSTEVFSSYLSAVPLDTYELFETCVHDLGIQAFLLNEEAITVQAFDSYARQWLNNHGWLILYETDGWQLFILNDEG